MSVQLSEIIETLEQFAPLAYQESYDNSGLLVGDRNAVVSRVLATIDCTEEVVEEAIRKQCELIVCHHPLIFKGLKSVTTSNGIGRTIVKALKSNISVYASHTNLDKVVGGVNFKMAEKLGLQKVEILAKELGHLSKLVVFVPLEAVDVVSEALFHAGAGEIGNYSGCSFQTQGIGSFTPNEKANPAIGIANQSEKVQEARLEVMFPSHLAQHVIDAMKKSHPYEEVAYYWQKLENQNQEVGLGAIGFLNEPIEEEVFIEKVKMVFDVPVVRHSPKLGKRVQTVALCGGAGSGLVGQAIAKGADCFLTADTKYHEFFEASGKIFYLDIGHFESEQFTVEIFRDVLSKYFPNIAVILTETVTNPVNYA